MTLMYNAKYTNSGKTEKTIIRNTLGAGQELTFTVMDDSGDVVNLSTLTTNMKVYIGASGALEVDGGTLTAVDASVGTFKYALTSANFSAEGDAGTHTVELQFADNATLGSATKIVRAGGLTLTVLDTIGD